MADDGLNDLKKLSPKERIRRLKELQDKNKKEIEEAQKMINASEEEDILEENLKKIPVPELKKVSIEDLFDKEEEPKKEEPEEDKKYDAGLEDSVQGVKGIQGGDYNSNAQQQGGAEYANRLMQRSVDELKTDLNRIQENIYQSGIASEEQRGELYQIGRELYAKQKDMEAGKYFADQHAKGEIQKMREKQKDLYRN